MWGSFRWSNSDGLYFWVFICYLSCRKSKLWDQKLINEGPCRSQTIVSHYHRKVMQENLINCSVQKVWDLTCHYGISIQDNLHPWLQRSTLESWLPQSNTVLVCKNLIFAVLCRKNPESNTKLPVNKSLNSETLKSIWVTAIKQQNSSHWHIAI
jgi:hypothetical protein